MYLLGYDIGSASIKIALIHAETYDLKALVQYPKHEMNIISRQRGWAEQHPEVWWQHVCHATQNLWDQVEIDPSEIRGIGISYQMHGLVLVGHDHEVLRPSIIWCDSRAVSIGESAFQEMGRDYCLSRMLNSPGNFTASKLKWVKDHEPHVYEQISKVLLPGDYIAMKLTGEAVTTISGLTEGIFWDFQEKRIARELLDQMGLDEHLLPETVPTFSNQGRVTRRAAALTGLAPGTPVTYRAGDQPNNALALNVMHPGEIAATSGTSGVVYGIVDQPIYDSQSRVNAFAHVNYEENFDRIGTLLCLNGAGVEYSWIKSQVARSGQSYVDMERMAATVPVGSDGLCMLPFGNGAERMLENRSLNAHLMNLDFNRHGRGHLYRASLEGVAFAFVYGVKILQELGLDLDVMRVSNDNMFRSETFSTTIATLLGCHIEVVDTTGAIGAARAAGISGGIYGSMDEALRDVNPGKIFEPQTNLGHYAQAYAFWESHLQFAMDERADGRRSLLGGPEGQGEESKKEIQDQIRSVTTSKLKLNAANELLAEAQTLLANMEPGNAAGEVRELVQRIAKQLDQERLWEDFEVHFDLLHDDFFKKLNAISPGLSVQELKMCGYLKLKFSTKEISEFLNLSIRGTETCRYRLRKKLGVGKGENFIRFLESLTSA
ncbi:FGGY family carbohydrate kinase [Pontibacter sp. G13]|uniref:FGGY family carbohydrate kinase n=1 Tax=Pontibacter sp. G13 TaxID=3074898 RepID=UPI00288A0FD5|nr:FGGY family carbohydrate kinase [Pontibacter sp. G13]WNJ19689.1 FGGY family carbohydrate kinase [Pontibacter sp. G13]